MQTIKIDLTVKPPRHSYKCLIVGRKFDLFHCCIGSAAWSGWKGRKVPRSQCSEWIRLGYSGHDCLWLKHTKRKKSWLSISDGYRKSLCVLLYVCICVYMCMGCDVNPCCWITSLCEIWQLPLLSLWQDKRAPVCVRDSDSEKEEEVATKKARNQSLFTQKNKYVHSSKCLFESLSVWAWTTRCPTLLWNSQQATTGAMVSAELLTRRRKSKI